MKIPLFSVFHAVKIPLFGDLHTVMTVGKGSSVFWTVIPMSNTFLSKNSPSLLKKIIHLWGSVQYNRTKTSFLKKHRHVWTLDLGPCRAGQQRHLESWSGLVPWAHLSSVKVHFAVPNLNLFSHSRGSKDAQFPFLNMTGRVHPSPEQNTSPQRDVWYQLSLHLPPELSGLLLFCAAHRRF